MGRRKNCSHRISTGRDLGPGWQKEAGGVHQAGGHKGTQSRGRTEWVISEDGSLPAPQGLHRPHSPGWTGLWILIFFTLSVSLSHVILKFLPHSTPGVECVLLPSNFGFSHMTSFGQWEVGSRARSEPLHACTSPPVPLPSPLEDVPQLPHSPKEDEKFIEQSQTQPATSWSPG